MVARTEWNGRMNGDEPRIEIFEPFGAAYEVMKKILFKPFDLAKWLTIAFAAFLSGAWGGGFNPSRFMPGDWKYRSTSQGNLPHWSLADWAIPAMIAAGLVLLVIVLALIWVTSRGRFIFTDCVVKNRGAIAEPWREYRREGNSFFLFSLLVAGAVLLLMGLAVLLIVLPMGWFAHDRGSAALGASAIVIFIVLGLVWLIFSIFFAVVSQFMVPVMYRRRCSAREAFVDVAKLVLSRPGPFVLLALFGLVLAIALGLVGMLISCLTCCIGSLPYVSTVLLLPGIVWLMAFKLLFIRQFGDQYDVWATVALPQPPATETPDDSGLPPTPPPPATQ